MLCWLNEAYGVCLKGSDSFLTELSQDVTGLCPMTWVFIARAPQGWYDKRLGLDGVQHNAEVVLNKA